PVGCGGVRRIAPSPDGLERYEVKHLWLAPAARGRGGGRMLLDELERRAVGFGAQELVLDTNASLAAAGRLYASRGYAAIEPYNENPNATNWYGKPVTTPAGPAD
ncbi:GNAT family N-acetyltransferase, partial [Agromyces sp. SYSU T0242]|uniref:GNAT family N-acetyltransferase n=1 Tax=Agromyces litoreus TaxID=3158561 RepID=UPI0033961E50